jgi:hypothetical protein
VTQPVREEVTRRIMAEIARLLHPVAEPGQCPQGRAGEAEMSNEAGQCPQRPGEDGAHPEATPAQCPNRDGAAQAVVNNRAWEAEMRNGLPGLTHGR